MTESHDKIYKFNLIDSNLGYMLKLNLWYVKVVSAERPCGSNSFVNYLTGSVQEIKETQNPRTNFKLLKWCVC